MRNISEYEGTLMNHLQGFYRSGDRALAIELVKALGLTCVEVPITDTFSLIRAHANAKDLDKVDNVIFLAEMGQGQAKLEALLQKRMATDPELNEAISQYRHGARTNGDGHSHFGLRFPSTEALQPVLEKLRTDLSFPLRDRVSMQEAPSYGQVADFPDIRQIFVYTDVFTFGSATYGQLIELQVERGK
jgi:hypothetical protein